MDNFTNEVIIKVNKLQDRITAKRKVMFFSRLLNEREFSKHCSAIFDIQAIIHGCLQYGNYRRACRYVMVANKIMDQLDQREKQIVDELTNIIIEE